MPKTVPKKVIALRNNSLQEVNDDEVDVEQTNPADHYTTHINLIPLQNGVQAARNFYGSRFFNQAMPLEGAEVPLVQNLNIDDKEGRSFDDLMGEMAGAVRAGADHDGGIIEDITPDEIVVKVGKERRSIDLYDGMPFNRKSFITNAALPNLKKGDVLKKGQLLATSNFTDGNGSLALGKNAVTALVPYQGYSMDDAVVVSEDFANRMKSEHVNTHYEEIDPDLKTERDHYVALFPTTFTEDQLKTIGDDGLVKKGTILKKGDPLILATRPKTVSSSSAVLGKLSRSSQQVRKDGSTTWDYDADGVVLDSIRTNKGIKVVTRHLAPIAVGDKLTYRTGQKGTVAKILSKDHMPRQADGQPIDVLLNHQGFPSRVNDSLLYEILLGKLAQKQGKPIKLPGFNPVGTEWNTMVRDLLAKHKIPETVPVFDPMTNTMLENPLTVGSAYVMKLHHTSESKVSARNQAGYDQDQQPSRGGSEGAKRVSGLEGNVIRSAGAYKNLKEDILLRGQRNDEFWKQWRMGGDPKITQSPFVWSKGLAMISGAGMYARDMGSGRFRLGPMTDRDLEEKKPITIRNGELIDLKSMEPIAGGLFDPGIVGADSWAKIPLSRPLPNPAMEPVVRQLLGLTQPQLREILAGRAELPEHLR